MALVIKYAIFALVATLANLLAQFLASRLYVGMGELYVSMGLGTLAGLIVKYALDKAYIFNYTARSFSEDGRKFILYSFMGLFTTLVFWGTELAFDTIFGTKIMRYWGAALGLSLGYWLKYRLDKRFVFGVKK